LRKSALKAETIGFYYFTQLIILCYNVSHININVHTTGTLKGG